MSPDVHRRVTDGLAPMQGELRALGLAVNVGSYNVSFSNEERDALMKVNAAKAKIHRQAMIAEIQKAEAAGAAPVGGGVPAIAPPQSPGLAQGGPASGAAKKGKGGLVVAIVLGVVVLSGAVALVVHFTHGESSVKAPVAPHDAKHGKH
jgi:hypothetical protein